MARILVVDDSETIRKFIVEVLKSEGHEIIGEAINGADGVVKFHDLRPDITTLDIHMPGSINGIEVLKKIMEIDPSAKIIMISSAIDDGNIPVSMIHGACEFIEKPFTKEELLRVISKLESVLINTGDNVSA